ncbi:MAG: sensor histidine kinase [Gammaproteobacteria bacterium]
MNPPEAVDTQNRYGLLRVYSYYRLALAALLLLMFAALRGTETGALMQRGLYLGTAVSYAVLNAIVLALVLARRRTPRPRKVFALLVLDIATLVVITHASGGINSGFAVLLMVTVGAGAVMVPGQIATLVAAVASIGVLAEALYVVVQRDQPVSGVFSAGVLGALLFASSLLVQGLAGRLARSQALAQQRAGEVLELQRVNQLIVQRMLTGILFIDAEDRIRVANGSAARLLGLPESVLGESGAELPATLAEALHTWRAQPDWVLPPIRPREDGPSVRLSFARIQAPAGDGTLVFAEDFTQITQQAQQLKLASLGRLTASIAHEIRNPLGSISHAAQLLRESPELPREDRRLVEIVIGNAQRTNEVVETVLTLSRGRLPQPERTALSPWLAAFVAEYHPQTNTVTPRIEVSVEPETLEVSMDLAHLRQVMQNLCDNGLRYSLRETGQATLALRASVDPESGLAALDVIDRGPGVPEESVDAIFEPFFTTETSGTGLGLYLSRELCEANRVRIEYRREPQGGSCFRLVFPHPDRRLSAAA